MDFSQLGKNLNEFIKQIRVFFYESSLRQNKAEVPFLPKPEEDVLEGAAGTLVGLQINYFSFLLAFFTGILLDKLHYIVFYVGYHHLAGVTNTLNTT